MAEMYPELSAHVKPIVDTVTQAINEAAQKTQSKMPYKTQFILEGVITELHKLLEGMLE